MKHRIAVIGHTGRGDYGHGIDTVWLKFPEHEIVGVADANADGLAKKVAALKAPKGYADYRKLLDETKPTIVSICPRHLDQHAEMVVAAAERGIHIFMEKPLCRTLAEADQMAAACAKHDVKLAIAFQTRHSPKLPVVRDLIADGKIGKILEVRGRGKEDPTRGGGEDLWVLGSHVFNLMHTFCGEPAWCFAQVLAGGHPIGKADVSPGKEGIGPLAGDNVAAMYGFADGVTGYFNSFRGQSSGETRFGLSIFGSKGVIELTTGYLPKWHFLPDPLWSPGRSKAAWQPISSAGLNEPEPLLDGGLDAGNVLIVHDLLAAITEDRQPEAGIQEGRVTVEMIAAVFESARVRGQVAMPLKQRTNPLDRLK